MIINEMNLFQITIKEGIQGGKIEIKNNPFLEVLHEFKYGMERERLEF